MTEVSFAKSFLATLQAKPSKIPADHVEDPKSYPARAPYILPRMAKPMTKRAAHHLAPGQERSVTVVVKSLRNPPLDIKLTSQPLSTSVLDIKAAVAAQARVPVEKLRMLHSKKPVADSKALKDLVADGEAVVELSVMVLGGAASVLPQGGEAAGKAAATAQGVSGAEVLQTEAFWEDLKGFLLQRVRDEREAEKLFRTFRTAWQAQR